MCLQFGTIGLSEKPEVIFESSSTGDGAKHIDLKNLKGSDPSDKAIDEENEELFSKDIDSPNSNTRDKPCLEQESSKDASIINESEVKDNNDDKNNDVHQLKELNNSQSLPNSVEVREIEQISKKFVFEDTTILKDEVS